MSCTTADYEAAAVAISKATDIDAQTRKRNGSKTWTALLACDEFHDRCMRLAKAIAYERANQARRDGADLLRTEVGDE